VTARALPAKFDQVLQSWDMAFKDTKSSDFVCGQVWAAQQADRYLLDLVHGRMDLPATLEAVKRLTATWPSARLKLVEDKANGPAVISSLQHSISGLIAVEPEGGKEARAHAVSPEIESGNVYVPHPLIATWVEAFLAECTAFPTGANDDRVDACTQALYRLQPKATAKLIAGAMWAKATPKRE
jgi:predicted phage terminase large subunit-like protein